VTAWADVLDRVIPLLRDAKKDCEVDCGPMALGKIDQAIRLLTAARQGERNRSRSDTPTHVGETNRPNAEPREVDFIPVPKW
jgi:hypothetical protein